MVEPIRDKPRVALFATCLVDLWRPSIGFAAAKLIEATNCCVVVPREQTCCGQPAYNAGDRALAGALVRKVIGALEGFDYVVVPSGSCAAMLKCHYPDLMAADRTWQARAYALAHKTYELTQFLVDVRKFKGASGNGFQGQVVVHDGCSGRRELGVCDQPRALLMAIEGVRLSEVDDGEACCGFGGTFSVKYNEISDAIAKKKCQSIEAAGGDVLVSCDLGCLMHLAGRLKRHGSKIAVRHVAEILADELTTPALGEGR